MPYKFNPFTGSLDETGATGATGATGTVSAAGPGSAAAPGIAFASDTDTGLFNSAANELAISTNGTGRLFVASDGTVGIGQASDSASYRLNVFNPSADFCGVSIGNNVSGGGYTNGLIIGQNQADALFSNRENGFMSFGTNNTERARIDSSGRLLVGTTAALSTSSNALIQAVNTSGGEIVIGRDFALGSNSTIGRLAFFTKPSAVAEAARIEAVADAVHSGGAPTRLVFSTTADGAASPTERMRIKSDGDVSIVTGNLIIGTAGKGIDFSADGSAAGMTSELLDDYEEGTWTPVYTGSTGSIGATAYVSNGTYTKI